MSPARLEMGGLGRAPTRLEREWEGAWNGYQHSFLVVLRRALQELCKILWTPRRYIVASSITETSTAAAQSTIAYQISIFIPSMKETHMVDVNPSTVPDKVTSQ